MRAYYTKYGLLFLTVVLLMNVLISIVSENKQRDGFYSVLFLNKAVETYLEQDNLNKINEILDLYPEKIILESSGLIISSNYGQTQEERVSKAQNELKTNKDFWLPFSLSGNQINHRIYHKKSGLWLGHKLSDNLLFSLFFLLFLVPLSIFIFRDVSSLVESVEYLHHYLDSTRLKLQKLKEEKDPEKVNLTDNQSEKEKIIELKNERKFLKNELEKKKSELAIVKQSIVNLKKEISNQETEKVWISNELKKVLREKDDLVEKIKNQESLLKSKNEEIGIKAKKIKELEDLIKIEREKVKIQESELNKQKSVKIDNKQLEELKSRNITLESDIIQKKSDIKDLLSQLALKNSKIEELDRENEEINFERLKLDDRINNLEVKINTDKGLIDALVHENNHKKDELMVYEDKIKELNALLDLVNKKDGNFITEEVISLRKMLKDKEQAFSEVMEQLEFKENSIKELTLDTLDKMSAIRRFEKQINELSREIIDKNNQIESLNTRVNMKEGIINSLNREIEEIKEQYNKVDKAKNEVSAFDDDLLNDLI